MTVRYVDFREEADARPSPGETPVRDAQGRLLAFALATPLNAEQRTQLWAAWSRGLMALLANQPCNQPCYVEGSRNDTSGFFSAT